MNKRLLLITGIILICSSLTKAQDQKFHFGLKVSPTMAWMKPDTKGVDSEGAKLGFSYGIITEFNFQENYAIASGVQVTYRGGKLSFPNPLLPGRFESTYNIQYIELPITLKMKTNDLAGFRYFGQFGFVPGVNISAKADIPGEDDADIKDDIVPVNVAMLIALGTEYTISGSTVLMTSLEFNNGFIDILEANSAKARTNYIALNIGVLF